MTKTLLGISIVVVLAACGDSREDDSRQPERTGRAIGEGPPPQGSGVLAAVGSDSVRVSTSNGYRQLLWTSHADATPVEMFRSGDLFEGLPTARLIDIDEDGRTDLFVAWQFEEQASGVALRATPAGAVIVYQSPESACRAPEIAGRDDNGRLLVVEYDSGAVSLADCRRGGPLATCVDNFFVTWPNVVAIGDAASPSRSPSAESLATFYSRVAARYGAAVDSMQAALTRDPASVCGAELIGKVRALQARATELSNGAPYSLDSGR